MRRTLVIVLALALGTTLVFAARFHPGDIHEEKGCIRIGGRVEGRTPRVVCTALMHSVARQDALIRYEEMNGIFGFQKGEKGDLILSCTNHGPCNGQPR